MHLLNVYTVAFFGHRRVDDISRVEMRLRDIIRELMCGYEYVEFLVGRNGEFDTITAAAVRRMKKDYRGDNSALVLVLPYYTCEYRDNEESFLSYYDEVEICNESKDAHFKSAIGIRNRKIVERADCVICHIERESGGAYEAVKYAKKLGKKIICT